MKKVLFIFFTMFVLIGSCSNSKVNAMDNWKVNEIARYYLANSQSFSEIAVKNANGENLMLSFDFYYKNKPGHILSAELKKGGDFWHSAQKLTKMDFPSYEDRVVVYQLTAQNPDTVMWCIIASNGNINGMDKLYIFGQYGDKYVQYITKATLDNAGWSNYLSADISSTEDGRILIVGSECNNDGYGRYWTPTKQYTLTWDDNANWFSLAYIQ